MRRTLPFLVGAALTAALVTPIALQAQPRAAAFKAPRNVHGQPDLQGHWSNATLTPESRRGNGPLVLTEDQVRALEGEATAEAERGDTPTDPNAPPPRKGGEVATNTRPEFAAAGGGVGGYNRGWLDPGHTVMRVGGQPRSSFITTENGRAPAPRANPGAQTPAPQFAVVAPPPGQRRGPADNPEQRSLSDRCIVSFGRNAGPPMLPNGFYNNNYQIVQGRDHVAITTEMVHDTRIVRLNSSHRTDGVRPYFGDSVGRYEGDTLVIETVNIPRNQAYMGRWENLKVTERLRRVGPDRILYQYTIEDPTYWDAPWGGEYEFSALNGRVLEYACHEGNYALEGILAGERAVDQQAAAGGGAN